MSTQTGPSPPHAHSDRRVTNDLECETPVAKIGGRGGADPPVACKERGQPPPLTHRTGKDGIAWDFMGVNGKRRAICNGKGARAILNAALLLVNHARCRSSSERVTTRKDRPARRAPLIRLARRDRNCWRQRSVLKTTRDPGFCGAWQRGGSLRSALQQSRWRSAPVP